MLTAAGGGHWQTVTSFATRLQQLCLVLPLLRLSSVERQATLAEYSSETSAHKLVPFNFQRFSSLELLKCRILYSFVESHTFIRLETRRLYG